MISIKKMLLRLVVCFLIFISEVVAVNNTTVYPAWPWDFRFELAGKTNGDNCVQIQEVMPITHFWYDNYFCVKDKPEFKDIGMQWSNVGPVVGKKCILTNEPSSLWVWFDNHVCFNNDVPYDIEWSFKGCIKEKACISWNEPASPYAETWWDDYLCATKTISNKTYMADKCSGAHIEKSFTFTAITVFAVLISCCIFFYM